MKLLLALFVLSVSTIFAHPEAANVLVIVNDATVAEAGTNGLGASQFVANKYVAARGIPASNIIHINAKGCCGFADGTSPKLYNNFHVSMDQYVSDILQPVKDFLETHGLKQQIKYIVPTYGVPTHIAPDFSVDSFLAQIYSNDDNSSALGGNLALLTFNLGYDAYPKSAPAHWSNVGRDRPVYLVVRLDGPTAMIAVGLVDKAIQAEKGISKSSGIGYFDWQNSGNMFDDTMKGAYDLCVSAGMTCSLNTQSVTRHMIDSAPNTLWAWGWYGGVNDVYTFVPGAVGAQLTSYTANDIRNVNNTAGAWVPFWLTKGITATWGATGEPAPFSYPKGDNLLNRLWNGYTFGEAAYLATPSLGWKIVFVGDPLYTPVFTVAPPQPVESLSVTPAVLTLLPGQAAQFSAKGLGADAVSWSVTANAGSVSASGLYTAPASLGSKVTATSIADPTITATASITFLASPATSDAFIPIRVNAGAIAEYTDVLGQKWSPDTGFNEACKDLTNAYPSAIIESGSNAPEVYRTYHYGSCTFTAVVPNGSYLVNLMFAEVALNGPGRSFDVDINGVRALAKFDIYQAAGRANRPVVKSFPVNVLGGRITVDFIIENYGPIINGIEILKAP